MQQKIDQHIFNVDQSSFKNRYNFIIRQQGQTIRLQHICLEQD